jgi:hypothetical protein
MLRLKRGFGPISFPLFPDSIADATKASRYVKPYATRQKKDAADAEAVGETASLGQADAVQYERAKLEPACAVCFLS